MRANKFRNNIFEQDYEAIDRITRQQSTRSDAFRADQRTTALPSSDRPHDRKKTKFQGNHAMSKTAVYQVEVTFGDCDPTGLVMAHNFSRWMDAASHNFFIQCGVPAFRELERTRGIAGHPLLGIHTKYFQPATDGDHLDIHTNIIEWREKVFIHKHVVMRGGEVLCESTETRAFVIRPLESPDRIKAIPVPEDIKALCS